MESVDIEKGKLYLIGKGSLFHPIMGKSNEYTNWETNFGPGTCEFCANQNGKIFLVNNPPELEPPVHPNCHYEIVPMDTIVAGTATIDGANGVDLVLWNGWNLPDNYWTKEKAKAQGYNNKIGNLKKVLPDITIGGDVYENKIGKLPMASGRIWYEVDINYLGGYRNSCRVLYSNDGLVFVTYDNYETFYQII